MEDAQGAVVGRVIVEDVDRSGDTKAGGRQQQRIEVWDRVVAAKAKRAEWRRA
jgi:hypothetical protein